MTRSSGGSPWRRKWGSARPQEPLTGAKPSGGIPQSEGEPPSGQRFRGRDVAGREGGPLARGLGGRGRGAPKTRRERDPSAAASEGSPTRLSRRVPPRLTWSSSSSSSSPSPAWVPIAARGGARGRQARKLCLGQAAAPVGAGEAPPALEAPPQGKGAAPGGLALHPLLRRGLGRCGRTGRAGAGAEQPLRATFLPAGPGEPKASAAASHQGQDASSQLWGQKAGRSVGRRAASAGSPGLLGEGRLGRAAWSCAAAARGRGRGAVGGALASPEASAGLPGNGRTVVAARGAPRNPRRPGAARSFGLHLPHRASTRGQLRSRCNPGPSRPGRLAAPSEAQAGKTGRASAELAASQGPGASRRRGEGRCQGALEQLPLQRAQEPLPIQARMQVKDPQPGESGKVGFRQENSCSSGFSSLEALQNLQSPSREEPRAAGGKGRSLGVGMTDKSWRGEAGRQGGFGEGQSTGARSLCPTQVVLGSLATAKSGCGSGTGQPWFPQKT